MKVCVIIYIIRKKSIRNFQGLNNRIIKQFISFLNFCASFKQAPQASLAMALLRPYRDPLIWFRLLYRLTYTYFKRTDKWVDLRIGSTDIETPMYFVLLTIDSKIIFHLVSATFRSLLSLDTSAPGWTVSSVLPLLQSGICFTARLISFRNNIR